MAFSVNSAGMAQSSQHSSTGEVSQARQIIKDLMATYQSLSMDTSIGSRVLNIISDLDSFVQPTTPTTNMNKAAILFTDAVALEHHMETADPEMLEAALESLDDVKDRKKGRRKGRLKVDAERGLADIYSKLKGKIPDGLLDQFKRVSQTSASSKNMSSINDKAYMEAMISALLEDGVGIDDLGELALIMKYLSFLGIQASSGILDKVTEAIGEFVTREINSVYDPAEIINFLNEVKGYVDLAGGSIAMPALDDQITGATLEIEMISAEKSFEQSTKDALIAEDYDEVVEEPIVNKFEETREDVEEGVQPNRPYLGQVKNDFNNNMASIDQQRIPRVDRMTGVAKSESRNDQSKRDGRERSASLEERKDDGSKPIHERKVKADSSRDNGLETPSIYDVEVDNQQKEYVKNPKVPYMGVVPNNDKRAITNDETPDLYRVGAKASANNQSNQYLKNKKKAISAINKNLNKFIDNNKSQISAVFIDRLAAMFQYKLGDAADLMSGVKGSLGIE